MGLKDIGAKLPPGFRFHPSDQELVCHYLRNKIRANFNHHDGGDDDEAEALKGGDLVEIDLHTCEPWQLPEVAKLNANEWYFFSFRDRKYATGYRTNRATTSGYWKATGKDRTVVDPRTREMVGMRKTLVFYKNRAPNGIKTSWIMHEFRLEFANMPPKEDWVLCRVFNKSKASLPDNSPITKFSFDNDTLFSIHTPNNLVYDPNYTNLPPPPPAPAPAASTSSPPSSVIDHHYRHDHHLHHHDHHEMMKIPCGSSSFGQGESLLNMVYDKDHYGNLFWDMSMEKTGMGSDVEDGLRFEIDNTIAFQ